jgi:hypothetical protein
VACADQRGKQPAGDPTHQTGGSLFALRFLTVTELGPDQPRVPYSLEDDMDLGPWANQDAETLTDALTILELYMQMAARPTAVLNDRRFERPPSGSQAEIQDALAEAIATVSPSAVADTVGHILQRGHYWFLSYAQSPRAATAPNTVRWFRRVRSLIDWLCPEKHQEPALVLAYILNQPHNFDGRFRDHERTPDPEHLEAAAALADADPGRRGR